MTTHISPMKSTRKKIAGWAIECDGKPCTLGLTQVEPKGLLVVHDGPALVIPRGADAKPKSSRKRAEAILRRPLKTAKAITQSVVFDWPLLTQFLAQRNYNIKPIYTTGETAK